MPDRMLIAPWYVLLNYGGRVEGIEVWDDQIKRYLSSILEAPRQKHPEIDRELTVIRVYRQVVDLETSDIAGRDREMCMQKVDRIIEMISDMKGNDNLMPEGYYGDKKSLDGRDDPSERPVVAEEAEERAGGSR